MNVVILVAVGKGIKCIIRALWNKKGDEIIDKGAYRHSFCAFDVEVGAQYAKPYGKILCCVLNIIFSIFSII